MARWFTLLALLCFVPQQFMCCAESCTTCPTAPDTASAAPVSRHSCEHCTHHGDTDAPTGPEQAPHHLCVATHLFYVARADSQPPMTDVVHDGQTVLAFGTVALVSALSSVAGTIELGPPPDSRQARAVLNVWIL